MAFASVAEEAKAWPGECMYLRYRIAQEQIALNRAIANQDRARTAVDQVEGELGNALRLRGGDPTRPLAPRGHDAITDLIYGLEERLADQRAAFRPFLRARLNAESSLSSLRVRAERARCDDDDDPPGSTRTACDRSFGSAGALLPINRPPVRNLVPLATGAGGVILFLRAVGGAVLQRAGGFIFMTQEQFQRIERRNSGDGRANYEVLDRCIVAPDDERTNACSSSVHVRIGIMAGRCQRMPSYSRPSCPLKNSGPYRLAEDPTDAQVKAHPCYRCPSNILSMSTEEWQVWSGHDLDAIYFRGRLFPTCKSEAYGGDANYWNVQEHRWEREPNR